MRRLVRELIETVLLALAMFLFVQFSVQNVKIEGSSMQPTLTEGQYLLVDKLSYARVARDSLASVLPFVDDDSSTNQLFAFHSPEPGEVIVFHSPMDPSHDFVKRVIAGPGDTVEIHEGRVLVNGVVRDEPYSTHPDRRTVPRIEVPRGNYYVLGDNRRASNDSRDWGPLPAENIVGRARLRYWPPENFKFLGSFSR